MSPIETEEKSVVAEWFKGKYVFVTGGTGYMGKVLLEKLLYSCGDVEAIYVLMRSKRGKTIQERLENIFSLPLFVRIRTINPKAFDKIVPIDGEVTKEGLGISSEEKNKLVENVSIVFHFAATVRLESELPDTLEINTAGTKRVIELCREMKKLEALVHVSTAFCSPDLKVFEEKVYDPPADPDDVLRTLKWMDRKALVKATPDIIKEHSTYTYSKRLAETLIAKEASNMRVAIVRPSIVTPTGLEPLPGWVDNLNGPTGVMAAVGKGVLRVMHCHGQGRVHMVPVDMATNAIIVAAWKLGSAIKRPEDVSVYNLTNDDVLQYTWFEIMDLARKHGYDYPFEMQIWYPNGGITNNYQIYLIWSVFVHWIPAIIIDAFLFLIRQERIMIRVQKKIYYGIELLKFFSTRNWVFRSENFLSLTNDLNSTDKEAFCMDFFRVPVERYLITTILGARQYCMKEDVKSLARCRILQKILFVVDILFKLLLVYGIFCLAWSCSDTVKYIYKFFKAFFETIF